MKNWVILFLGTILISSCKKENETVKPTVGNITEAVYASARVVAKDHYDVFATVNGIISKIFVTENDLVKVGTPLMQITDKSTIINSANAGLAANFSDINSNREKLTNAKSNISLAQSKLSNDSLLFRRQQSLWAQKIGSRVDLEQRELVYINSKAAVETAKRNYTDLLKQLEFNAIQAKNNLKISRYKEGDFTVKSEIDGKVYSITKEVGEMVSPQTSLGTIGNATDFLLELQIDEYDIAKIRIGQTVLLTMDSYKGEVFEAKISKIYPLMNERSRSFAAEAEFVRMPQVLFPNLTAEANIVIKTKKDALTIPRSYLLDDSLVIVEHDKRRKVVTGLKDYQKVEIISGMTADDVIYKPQ